MYPYNNYNNFNIGGMQQGIPVRVTGRKGADEYQVEPNNTVVLFDNNEDVFYFKSVDGIGNTTVRTFEFKEIEQSSMQYVTKRDFDEFRKGISEDVKQLIQEFSNGEYATGDNASETGNAECE